MKYKMKHFQDRSEPQYFIHYMVRECCRFSVRMIRYRPHPSLTYVTMSPPAKQNKKIIKSVLNKQDIFARQI